MEKDIRSLATAAEKVQRRCLRKLFCGKGNANESIRLLPINEKIPWQIARLKDWIDCNQQILFHVYSVCM